MENQPSEMVRPGLWAHLAARENALRTSFLSLATTRTRHVGNDPAAERHHADLWSDESRSDVPDAEIHISEAGHFLINTVADEIAALIQRLNGVRAPTLVRQGG